MPFYRSSQIWVVEFTYDGRPRRWLKALRQGTDAPSAMRALLTELYGPHAKLAEVRPAHPEEEMDYVHGNLPHNAFCPSARTPET
jgi:hypothetical protein